MRYGSPNFAALNWSPARVARAKQFMDTAHRMSTASTGFATAAPQAPLDAQLLTFPSDDLRGYQSDGPLSHVHHDHPLVDASLWRGQPHSWSSIHGFQHVIYEAPHFPSDLRHTLCLPLQDRIRLKIFSVAILGLPVLRCTSAEL